MLVRHYYQHPEECKHKKWWLFPVGTYSLFFESLAYEKCLRSLQYCKLLIMEVVTIISM